ncbi:hypothetical protein [Crateriforma conspicua]|uniref:Uncharacterized protein n=1 Tax=Crateriforma conspicua TaxID=2527996 RepID=A0A5C5Y441_9PLAN|nr:hypothetical protein [Crateriforma conspicua]TWT69728.1 hypothetical protein Pan14r_20200 [Crateriforma conspicua]
MEPNRREPNPNDVLGPAPSCLTPLVEEYAALVPDSREPNWELIEAKLIDHHEWTPDAAHSLVKMAKQYGWFFLRNAAALAIACDHEDGDLGI